MQFIVPQFIERKPKIIGPLTFRQFVFVGTAAGICLFLYFMVPLYLFVIVAIFLLGAAFALAFVKIGKESLPVIIKNFIIYVLNPKIYLWKKKTSVAPDYESKRTIHGKLNKLSTRIQTKNKP